VIDDGVPSLWWGLKVFSGLEDKLCPTDSIKTSKNTYIFILPAVQKPSPSLPPRQKKRETYFGYATMLKSLHTLMKIINFIVILISEYGPLNKTHI